jgi:hypothetical protein
MRILVCTKLDLHGAHFANRLLPALAGHEVPCGWPTRNVRPKATSSHSPNCASSSTSSRWNCCFH